MVRTSPNFFLQNERKHLNMTQKCTTTNINIKHDHKIYLQYIISVIRFSFIGLSGFGLMYLPQIFQKNLKMDPNSGNFSW